MRDTQLNTAISHAQGLEVLSKYDKKSQQRDVFRHVG
jgi:hypothetical protein